MTVIYDSATPIVLNPVRVEITYFNLHGKMKYDGSIYVLPDTQVYQLADELRLMFATGQRPGMASTNDETWVNSYIIHVDASKLTSGFPFLIAPRQANPLDLRDLRVAAKSAAGSTKEFTKKWQALAVPEKARMELQMLVDSITMYSDQINKLADKIGAANEQTISE